MKPFSNYPKMMVHPASQPAIIGFNAGEGRPMTFPPVQVENEDQEEAYKAKGYVLMGSPDMAAYEQVRVGGLPPHYKYQEYPKFIRVDGEEHLATCEAHEHELLGYNPLVEHHEHIQEKLEQKEKRKPGRPKKPTTDHMVIHD